MNRNQRRSKVGLVVLSSGLVAALALPSASAALTDGKFLVHAWNIQDSSIEATAGIGGLQSGEGSGGGGNTGGGSEDTSPVARTIKAGPLSLTITESMIELSEANRKAYAEGRTGDIRTSPDGWQTIWTYDATGRLLEGYVPGENAYFALSKSSADLTLNELVDGFSNKQGNVIAVYTEGETQGFAVIQAVDQRAGIKDGAVYSYTSVESNSEGLGRYMTVEGKLVAIYVSKSTDRIQVQREPKPGDSSYSSSRVPYLENYTLDGKLTSIGVKYPDSSLGYTRLDLDNRDDMGQGTQVIQYRDRVQGTGPELVVIRDGKLVSADYKDASGSTQSIQVSSAAEYNSASGQSWDGKLAKFSDFETSIPFMPND